MSNVVKFRKVNVTRFFQCNSFWLAILLHGIILLMLSIVITFPQKQNLRPDLTVPSYVYHEIAPSKVEQKSEQKEHAEKKNGFEKASSPTSPAQPENPVTQPQVISISKPTEPVHLIGDKTIDAPLLTLLGKALTKQVIYPKIAIDFNIHGTAVIGFLLQPNGNVSNVQLVRSSGVEVLDSEAVRAVFAISPVKHVDTYLKDAKYLIIGIIFG